MIARLPSYRLASGQYGRQRAIESLGGLWDIVGAIATGGASLAVQAGAAGLAGVPVPSGVLDIVEFLYKATGIDKQVALFTAIWNGENVGQAFVEAAKSGLHMAALVAGFFPGIGTVVGAVLSFADALVSGESITDALLNGIAGAIPGGLLAKEAWIAGRALAEGILAGEDLDAIGLRIAKAEVVENARIMGGERAADLAAAAFDLALGLARGKKVQDAVKSVLAQAATALAGSAVQELKEAGQRLGGRVLDSFVDKLPVDALDKALKAGMHAVDQAKAALSPETFALCQRIVDEKADGVFPPFMTVDGLAAHLGVDLDSAHLVAGVFWQIANAAGIDDIQNYTARTRQWASPFRKHVTDVAFELTLSRSEMIKRVQVAASPLTLARVELGARVSKLSKQVYTGYTGPALNTAAMWRALRTPGRDVVTPTRADLADLAATAPLPLVPPPPMGLLDRLRARAGGHTPPVFIAASVILVGGTTAALLARRK